MKDISINKSLIFDLDGTLIDISLRDYKVYYDILTSHNKNVLFFDKYWNLRRNKTNIREILQLTNNISDDFFNFFILNRKDLIEEEDYLILDSLFKDTIQVLEYCSCKYNCYLITSRNNIINTQKQIDRLGLRKYFNDIIITNGSKIDFFKSIKEPYFVIGDTENDITAANDLQINNIAVTTGIRSAEFLERINSKHIVHSLGEIINIV